MLDVEAVRVGVAETFSAKYQQLLDANLRTFDAGRDEVVEQAPLHELDVEGEDAVAINPGVTPKNRNRRALGYETAFMAVPLLRIGRRV